jgi:MFS family permease
MLTAILPVRSLLLAIFMLMAGGGVLSTLLSLRLEQNGVSAPLIGLVATAYFAGLTLGSVRVGPLIQRVGHIRAFAGLVSIFSASSLAYPLHTGVALWALLRFVDGLCMAGVFVCLESWLNERADAGSRGTVLAGYMISIYCGQALGQFLLNLNGDIAALPFMAASILISLAVVPVVLTRIPQPEISDQAPYRLTRLYAISPLAVVGAAATGVMLGGFYGLGAVYTARLGLGLQGTALFMSSVILGGVLLQYPLGWLSDRYDRRSVITACFAAAFVVCLCILLVNRPGLPLLVLGALFGGASFALYPLSVSHANDQVAIDERVGASGGLVLLYSAGAAVGPLLAAGAMSAVGRAGLFGFIGAAAAVTAAFGLWRIRAGAPIPEDEQQPFQSIPRTTPAIAALDTQVAED